MQMKLEERSLRRIVHVLRIENTRLTKRVTMRWPRENIKDWHLKQEQTTIGEKTEAKTPTSLNT